MSGLAEEYDNRGNEKSVEENFAFGYNINRFYGFSGNLV